MKPKKSKKAPPPAWGDGDYVVTPPVWGCSNLWVGAFADGDEPRTVTLSAEQAAELAGPNHPFTLEPVVAADPPTEE